MEFYSMISKNEILDNLPQFTGTTQYYHHSLLGIQGSLTDGAKYLAESAECYWLIDAILSHQINPVVKNHPELKFLQFWKLSVSHDNSAVLSVEWDKDEVVETQTIEYTDFPLDFIQLYCSPRPQGFVIYLPSEY